MTVKNRELRATDARAFIKIRRQVLLKENNHLARIMVDLRARQESLSLSLSSYGLRDLIRAMTNVLRNTASIRPLCRDASRRVASRHLVPAFQVAPSCRDAIRLRTRIFMPLYSIILTNGIVLFRLEKIV